MISADIDPAPSRLISLVVCKVRMLVIHVAVDECFEFVMNRPAEGATVDMPNWFTAWRKAVRACAERAQRYA